MKFHNILFLLSIAFINGISITTSWASHPITIDGLFDDWSGIPLAAFDPEGDNIIEDFAELKITNDNDFLFLNFSFHNGDQLLEDNNNAKLYIDTDNNIETGLQINGIGAELELEFGFFAGYYHHASGSDSIYQNDITLRRAPCVSAERFEIGISRNSYIMTLNGTQVADTVCVLFVESDPNGDTFPDNPGGIRYIFDTNYVEPPEPIPLTKFNESDIRILTYNVQNHRFHCLDDEQKRVHIERVLKALNPDIIGFQHVHTDSTIDSLITSWFPNDTWYRLGSYGPPGVYMRSSDKFIFSKYRILEESYQFIKSERMYAALLDTKQELGSNMLFIDTHLWAYSSNDSLRQDAADNFIQVMRDWRDGEGPFPLEDNTPFFVVGDFNMYGRGQVLRTMRDGDIWNEADYGADFPPDWDGTSIVDIFSRHTHIRMGYTWRNDHSIYPPGKLDYIFYSNSNIEIGNHFILNTLAMSETDLLKYNLQREDTDVISEHLPHVADIVRIHPVGLNDNVGFEPPHEFKLYSAYPNPFNSTTKIMYNIPTIGKVILKIYNTMGQEIKTIVNITQHPGQKSVFWDGRDNRGHIVSSGVYIYVIQFGDIIQSRKILYLK